MLSLETALFQRGFRTGSRSVRTSLGFPAGRLGLRTEPWPLHVITYNTALIVAPASYFADNDFRPLAVDEFRSRIEAERPDVVGLCEVFKNEEREDLANRLRSLYPYQMAGPDEADYESDGGLLLLSRHPATASTASIYRITADEDGLANKGVLHMRIAPPGMSQVDLFFTHTQNQDTFVGSIESDAVAMHEAVTSLDLGSSSLIASGRDALRQQLSTLGAFIAAVRDPDIPALLFGDLNFAALDTELYAEAMTYLAPSIDLWTAQRSIPSPENTSADSSSRLDYILLYPGFARMPIMSQMEILRWTRNGQNISDHYGLRARFDHTLVMDPGEGPVSGVSAKIISVHCINATTGSGNDSVTFHLTATTAAGSGQSGTAERSVGGGGAFHTPESGTIYLVGDPGQALTLRITGTEHDNTSADDSLGDTTISVPRWLLSQYCGRSFTRSIFLNGDGGQYSVTISIDVQ